MTDERTSGRGTGRTRTRARSNADIANDSASMASAHPGPTVATSTPPNAVPRIEATLLESRTKAFADCRSSSRATWGTNPVSDG